MTLAGSSKVPGLLAVALPMAPPHFPLPKRFVLAGSLVPQTCMRITRT